jgi:hypothetical protein
MAAWIVILLVILMVVGSVAWVRPSPRDKRLAAFRRDAIVAGIKVSLIKMVAEPRDSGIRDDIEGASYILYERSAVKGDDKKWAVVKAEGWLQDGLPESWSWYKQEDSQLAEAIVAHIKNAPIPIKAIERTPVLSRIIWDEKADAFNPEVLKEYLTAVQATV